MPPCEDPRCPEFVRNSCAHSPLLCSCRGTAAAGAKSQVRLWPARGSKHSVGEWWSFPTESSLLGAIVLPPEHKHRQLVSLDLHVRRRQPGWPQPHLSPFTSPYLRYTVCTATPDLIANRAILPEFQTVFSPEINLTISLDCRTEDCLNFLAHRRWLERLCGLPK